MSLDLVVAAEQEKRRRRREGITLNAPEAWDEWLTTLFPKYFSKSFAPRHIEFWNWVESIEKGVRPHPFVGLWGRGGAKSTNAEGAAIKIAAKGVRRYVWYVSSTQEKADQHVGTIGAMLEDSNTNKYYPDLSNRALNKYGNSKGWRRERLRTASGFTIDALGLDTGARGAKIDEQRPDLIIIDDVDDIFDTFKTTIKKITVLTKSVLPAGSIDCAVLFIQNLIHSDSIASRLSDGRADFLTDRIISGPHPAVKGLVCEQDDDGVFRIKAGTPTWEGQNLEVCQSQIFTWGYSSFMTESQHEVDKGTGPWKHIVFRHVTFAELPEFVKTEVWIDPAVSETDESDSNGISAGGLTRSGLIIGIYFWEGITSPEDVMERGLLKAIEIHANKLGVETDQGGDTWRSTYKLALEKVQRDLFKKVKRGEMTEREYNNILWPAFTSRKASGVDESTGHAFGSKSERNAKMLADYERGQVVHMIGTHATIEKALYRFPKKPLDVADSWFWCWHHLRNRRKITAR